MELKELEFKKLLPAFMQNDDFVKVLAGAIDTIFKPLSDDIKNLSDWDRIDTMPESELDYLADEVNISWYDRSADIEVKRSLCKNSDKIFMQRGTVAAIAEIVDTFFPDAYLKEFFEYGGEPHYFKVFSNNPKILESQIDLFFRVLEKVKRKSQWLECIEFQMQGFLKIPACIKVIEETAYLMEIGV